MKKLLPLLLLQITADFGSGQIQALANSHMIDHAKAGFVTL